MVSKQPLWCVDISSLNDDYSKFKDKMYYSEMLEWLNGFGTVNVDYVIESAVQIFEKEINGEIVVEDVQKKQSLTKDLLDRAKRGSD
tara:strand:+ start:558 stop:818 length:261 start_codon:yes stop_codon:yes gene_type:complete